MPTRLYFSNENPAPCAPAFDAAWDSNTGRRVRAHHVKAHDEITANLAAYTAGNDHGYVQAISSPLKVGTVLDTSVTVDVQIQALEEALTDNVDSVLLGIRVVSEDGSTVRATLLAVGSYGPTTEFNLTTPRNKTAADGDALTGNYTTIDGDRLAIELGFTDSAGASPSAALALGMDEEDLLVDETETAEKAGWIEFSSIFTFEAEGPTRLWLPSTEAAAVSPAFEAGWEYNSEAVRRRMRHVKDIANTLADGATIGAWNAGEDALDRQYVSDPMVAGIVFDTSVSVHGFIRCREVNVADNVTTIRAALKIVSEDGGTVRATLLSLGSHSGSTTELTTSNLGRRMFNDTALSSNYTTVDGDRVVLEVGYTDTSGTTPEAIGVYGMAGGDILRSSEQVSQTGAPWLEFDIPITFRPGTTRFYFPAVEAAPVECPLDADWDYVSEIRYRRLRPSKEESNVQAGVSIGNWTPGELAMDRQYVSDPLIPGQVFDSSVHVKMQLMCRELATNDQVGTALIGLRIMSLDGQTTRHVCMAVGSYSPTTTEWTTTSTNKTWADGDALSGSYETVEGDRLVLEIGYTDTAGTSPGAASQFGCEAADLPENEVDTTAAAGWIEFDADLFFLGVHPFEAESTVTPDPGVGAATAPTPTARVDTAPASGVATGTSPGPTASVQATPAAGASTATATAPAVLLAASPASGVATASSTAPTAQVTSPPASGVATATAASPQPQVQSAPGAGIATATGTSPNLTITASPAAAVATATVPAVTAGVPPVTRTPDPATATATADTPSGSVQAPPGSAVATAAAPTPTIAASVASAAAEATGTAPDPTAKVEATPAAGAATGASTNPTPMLHSRPPAAEAFALGVDATGLIVVMPLSGEGTATANDVQTALGTVGSPGAAGASAVAPTPTGLILVFSTTGTATASSTNPTGAVSVTPAAAAASAAAPGLESVSIQVAPLAGVAIGDANSPTLTVTAFADPAVALTGVPQVQIPVYVFEIVEIDFHISTTVEIDLELRTGITLNTNMAREITLNFNN